MALLLTGPSRIATCSLCSLGRILLKDPAAELRRLPENRSTGKLFGFLRLLLTRVAACTAFVPITWISFGVQLRPRRIDSSTSFDSVIT